MAALSTATELVDIQSESLGQPSLAGYGRRVLSNAMRRALTTRLSVLEAEQREDADYVDRLYDIEDEVLHGMLERQERIRTFRDILQNAAPAPEVTSNRRAA